MVTKLLFTAAIILIVLFGWKFIAQLAKQQGNGTGSDKGGSGSDAPPRRLNREDEKTEDLEWDEETKSYRPRDDRGAE